MRRAFFFIGVFLFAATSFASIPRASVLDAAPPIDGSLSETRIRVSEVLAPFERPAESELTRALRQAYEHPSTTEASGLGRFLSVDPARDSVDPTAPQTWNRYTYAWNNPLKFIDPTGKNATVVCDADNNCTATVEAQIVADPNDAAQMAAARDFANGATNYWQGRQESGLNGENITFQVNISIVAPGQAVDGVDTLTVMSDAGRSNVQMTLLTGGGNAESAPDTGTIFTTDNTNNPSGMAGVAPHETGHLFGLKDIYPPAGVASWNAGPTESIMMYAQPTNAVRTGWWVLHPANGNSVVHRQEAPPRRCPTGPC